MPTNIPSGINREHILEAITQLDQGREHHFADSTVYDLIHEGRRYPPKAVVGIASEIVTGREFHPRDFSGGLDSTCFRVLQKTGFEILPKVGPATIDLEPGEVYKRTEIHAAFGGQRQGGISTPAKGDVVLIFSGKAGEAFGYEDGWTDDGELFKYTGEGQTGDMQFTKGNLAIREHAERGKKIQLFFYIRKGFVKYHGEVQCVDYELFQTPDITGAPRQGIRFILEDVAEDVPVTGSDKLPTPAKKRPYKAPDRTERKGLVTSRVGQGYYRQQVLEKYNYRCAVTDSSIAEVLIASHIVPWRESSDEERLDPDNGILLSPNYDALFDRHLISFDIDGKIMISPLLGKDSITEIGIDPNARITVTEGMEKYLTQHRSNLRH